MAAPVEVERSGLALLPNIRLSSEMMAPKLGRSSGVVATQLSASACRRLSSGQTFDGMPSVGRSSPAHVQWAQMAGALNAVERGFCEGACAGGRIEDRRVRG